MGIFEQLAEIRAEEVKRIEERIKQRIEKGIEKGKLEERKKSVELVLTNTEFSVSKIASIFGVSRYFVSKVKVGLNLR
jgi:DNA invertase Pin-like site-specific DNA recombinase